MPDLPAQLYFAYGSNLWLQQMASRCPESYYVGRAVLMDHRWQINSRGFANVIPCSGYNVHGLVYQVSVDDEARLDRNEGVHSGAYTKSYHSVVLHEAVEDIQLPTRYLVQDGGLDKAVNAVRSGSRSHEPEQQGRIRSNVLVYLSSRYSQWGIARDEYIDRMNCGIRDAVTLGIPSDFFENTIPKSLIEEGGGAHLHSAEHGAVHFSAKAQPWGEVYALPSGFQDLFRNQPPGRGGGHEAG
ncbi:AIG2 family [Fusarium mundagurra]|uniref:gamma-glutamylcyclotransferase n=1 Tax=Fusarium mundagurra TaxID=1567541 RepID=A0A8H6DRG4_9HYPO|nr:AIG2 family [Fusarium mundagurra]